MIVVTGGAGFIGSVILGRLNQEGVADVLVVDQNAKNSPKWANIADHRFESYMDSDEFIAALEADAFKNVKAVFHMGACSDTTETDKDFLRKNNSEYSERIAKWCVANGAYLSYASSAATYGDGELGFSDDDALTPRLKPLNPYGQSKLDFDNWVLKNGLDKKITGFRFFNVYGPNEYHKGSMRSMAQKGFEQILADGKLRLFKSYKKEYADGGQKRDFVYVKDTVDALMWFWKHPEKTGIFNLGTGRAESWNDMADALFAACDVPRDVEYVEMPESIRNQYQYFTEADMAKFRSTGCPVTFRGLKDGVADYIRTHLTKENPYF